MLDTTTRPAVSAEEKAALLGAAPAHDANGVNVAAVKAALADLIAWNRVYGDLGVVPHVAMNMIVHSTRPERFELVLAYLLGACDLSGAAHPEISQGRNQMLLARQRMKAAVPGRLR